MATKRSTHLPGSGDVELTLAGQKFVLRPTLNAGLGISSQIGGIRTAIDQVMAMNLATAITVVTLGIGLEESRKVKNLEQLVFEEGMLGEGQVMAKCVEYLTNLSRGGRPAPKGDEEEEEGEQQNPPKAGQ